MMASLTRIGQTLHLHETLPLLLSSIELDNTWVFRRLVLA
jgi:hypothetical protein